jgi:hypothetical protein
LKGRTTSGGHGTFRDFALRATAGYGGLAE